MIAGTILIAGGLALAGVTITAAGPVLYGLAPLLAVGLLLAGVRMFDNDRRRRKANRRGGFIYGRD